MSDTVNLVPHWQIGDVVLTSYPFGVNADSTVDIGEPEMVVETVPSLLADGDHERVIRHGNRTYVLEVFVEGPTLGKLAESEALLRAQLRKPMIPLLHDPGDSLSPVSVYEVQTARLTPQRSDDHESHLIRKFTLTLTCSPFARSEGMVTVDALTIEGTPSTVVVDDCGSTAGWAPGTTPGGDTLSQSGGAVWSTDAVGGNDTVSLYRAASIDVSGYPYFTLEWKPFPGAGFMVMGMPAAANQFPKESYRAALPDGWIQSVWLVEPGDLDSGFQFSYRNTDSTVPGDNLGIREVSKSNLPPSVTSRQLARIIDVGGTERTPCSLKVVPGAAEALGLAIVHTSPESGLGYSPALRQWRVSGNAVTAEAGSLSGEKEAVTGTPIVAQMPIVSLPEDGYALMAYMRSSAVGTFPLVWQARTTVDSVYYGGHEGVANAYFPVANQWTLIPLAVVTLPPVRAALGGVVQFNLTRTVVDEEIYLDEWWPFRMGDDCALTIVKSDEASFLWLDSPDSSSPVPRAWVSNNSDRSDERHPGAGLIAQGNHVLTPEGTMVFVASTGIEYPALSATYHKRWHSNAAE